jgi:hypothetical protein
MQVAQTELTPAPPVTRRQGLLIGLLIAAAFVVSHNLAPLYTSNQNTKFVIGMARAGVGSLNEDYLAHTTDPFPLFTGIVFFTHAMLSPAMYYVYAALLMTLYVYGMLGIARQLLHRLDPPMKWTFAALLIIVHAAVLRIPIRDHTGRDILGLLQDGMASQYILGPIFQPSMFGVLLLCAIRWYLEDHFVPCVLGIVIAAAMHPSYVLISVLLAVAMAIGLLVQRRWIAAAAVLVVSVVLILPPLIHLKHAFAPTDPATYKEAQRILSEERIPHHMLVKRFFRGMAVLQILWVIAAIVLARKSRLMLPLVIVFGLAMGLTLAAAFGPESVSLRIREIQPWRATAWAIPVATAILLSFTARTLGTVGGARLKPIAIAAIVLCVVGGVIMQIKDFRDERKIDYWGVTQYVRGHHHSGETYVVPVHGKDLTSFIKFRLEAEAATYATFKSHPNKDVELLAWFERYKKAEAFYDAPDPAQREAAMVALLTDHPTHIIVPADSPLLSDHFDQVWSDAHYMLYRVR